MPTDDNDLEREHKRASYHRAEVAASSLCACFYCCQTFAPAEIVEWTDGEQTAVCPKCTVDSVLPEPHDPALLESMHAHWFYPIRENTGSTSR